MPVGSGTKISPRAEVESAEGYGSRRRPLDQFHTNLPAPGDNPGDRFEIGSFDFHEARTGILRDRPSNIFQVKATYWIGR